MLGLGCIRGETFFGSRLMSPWHAGHCGGPLLRETSIGSFAEARKRGVVEIKVTIGEKIRIEQYLSLTGMTYTLLHFGTYSVGKDTYLPYTR